MSHKGRWETCGVIKKKNKMRVVSTSSCWKLTSIWCSASFGELDASLLGQRKALLMLSHPALSLKIPMVWLVLMLAAHWQTDWLVWEKEEGKRGRVWMEKKSPSSDWQAGRTDGAQFFQAFSEWGAVSSPFQHLLSPPPVWVSGAPRLGPLDSLALYSASFQTVKKTLTPPTPRPPTTTSLDAHQRAPSSAQSHDGRARAPSMRLLSSTCGTGGGLYWKNPAGIWGYHTNVTPKL